MVELRTSWKGYIWRIAIPVLLGWAVARSNFLSAWQGLAFVLAVVIILLGISFPWVKLRHGGEESESARKSLVGVSLALIALMIFGYEIVVLGRMDWFVDHALVLLIVPGGLILLLKSWITAKRHGEGSH